MNAKSLVIGVILLAGGIFLGRYFNTNTNSNTITTNGKWSALHEHDEPVIIENGSLVIDMNPRDNENVLGDIGGAQTLQFYSRFGSDPIHRIRVFKKPKGGSFEEQTCGGQKCLPQPKTASELGIALSNGYTVQIAWGAKAESGIHAYSQLQRFDKEPRSGSKNPHRIKTRPDSGGGQPTIAEVQFIANGQEWKFAPEKDGDIVVQLCASDPEDAKHCTYYMPTK